MRHQIGQVTTWSHLQQVFNQSGHSLLGSQDRTQLMLSVVFCLSVDAAVTFHHWWIVLRFQVFINWSLGLWIVSGVSARFWPSCGRFWPSCGRFCWSWSHRHHSVSIVYSHSQTDVFKCLVLSKEVEFETQTPSSPSGRFPHYRLFTSRPYTSWRYKHVWMWWWWRAFIVTKNRRSCY